MIVYLIDVYHSTLGTYVLITQKAYGNKLKKFPCQRKSATLFLINYHNVYEVTGLWVLTRLDTRSRVPARVYLRTAIDVVRMLLELGISELGIRLGIISLSGIGILGQLLYLI